jgi:hypothetical protein
LPYVVADDGHQANEKTKGWRKEWHEKPIIVFDPSGMVDRGDSFRATQSSSLGTKPR